MLNLDEAYKAAHDAHRHYDNISLAVISAKILVAAGAFTFAGSVEETLVGKLLFGFAFGVLVCLHVIYRSLSTHAGVARTVAANIEQNGSGAHKLSTVYVCKTLYNQHRRPKGCVYRTVLALTALLCAAMLFSAFTFSGAAPETADAAPWFTGKVRN